MKKSNISPDITKLSFEEALDQLENIVSKLEDGSIPYTHWVYCFLIKWRIKPW